MMDALEPGVVYHLAGAVTARPDLSLVRDTFESLLWNTVNILQAAAALRTPPRVVIAGSLTAPTAEDAFPDVGSPYAAAKWAGSIYARMFHRVYGAPVISARIGFAYGPGQPEHRVIPYVIDSYLRGRTPKLSAGRMADD